ELARAIALRYHVGKTQLILGAGEQAHAGQVTEVGAGAKVEAANVVRRRVVTELIALRAVLRHAWLQTFDSREGTAVTVLTGECDACVAAQAYEEAAFARVV